MRLITPSVSFSSTRTSITRTMLPSNKLALLKATSTEKLPDLVLIDHCADKLVPVTKCLELSCQHFGRVWSQLDTLYRDRVLELVAKNWLRLLISLFVFVAQFNWIVSSYVESHQSDQHLHNTHLETTGHDAHSCMEQLVWSSGQDVNMWPGWEWENRSFLLADTATTAADTIQHNHSLTNVHRISREIEFQHHHHRQQQKQTPSTNTETGQLVALIWKIILVLKLSVVMGFFELLRLSDTLVDIVCAITQQADNCPDDKSKSSLKKSPVDVGYIERNRGYK